MKICNNCVNGYGWASGDHEITWDGMYRNIEKAARNVVHELGHLFDRAVCASNSATGSCYDAQGNDLIWGNGTARADLSAFWSGCSGNRAACLTRNGYDEENPKLHYGFAGGFGEWQFGATHGSGEVFADMFVGWVYNTWEDSTAGRNRSKYMNRENPVYLTTNLASP